MISNKKKLQLNDSLLLSLKELKNVIGAVKGDLKPESRGGCTNCDAQCQVTCAYYTH